MRSYGCDGQNYWKIPPEPWADVYFKLGEYQLFKVKRNTIKPGTPEHGTPEEQWNIVCNLHNN